MLHNKMTAALNNRKGLGVLQHHPKQRCLRNEGLYFLTDCLITGALNHILQKTGAIVVIHCQDALLYLRLHKSRRKGSQIASFGMTSHIQGPRRNFRHSLQIPHCFLLGRYTGTEGHVEILFPTGDAEIRSPIGYIMAAVSQIDGDGSKLLFRLPIQLLHMIQ